MPRKKKEVKQNLELYHKGKRLNKIMQGAVYNVMKARGIDKDDKVAIKKFYTENKEHFNTMFSIGLDSIPQSIKKVEKDLNTAGEQGYTFFKDKNGKKTEISLTEAKFLLAKTAFDLNTKLDAAGIEYSYTTNFDGTIVIKEIPEDEIDEISGEQVEFIVDYLSDLGVNVYISTPEVSKNFDNNEDERKRFTKDVSERYKRARREFKQYKQQLRQRKEIKESKNKRKKGK